MGIRDERTPIPNVPKSRQIGRFLSELRTYWKANIARTQSPSGNESGTQNKPVVVLPTMWTLVGQPKGINSMNDKEKEELNRWCHKFMGYCLSRNEDCGCTPRDYTDSLDLASIVEAKAIERVARTL